MANSDLPELAFPVPVFLGERRWPGKIRKAGGREGFYKSQVVIMMHEDLFFQGFPYSFQCGRDE